MKYFSDCRREMAANAQPPMQGLDRWPWSNAEESNGGPIANQGLR